MNNENVEIKTNEVNLDTVRSVANLTRKDWFFRCLKIITNSVITQKNSCAPLTMQPMLLSQRIAMKRMIIL